MMAKIAYPHGRVAITQAVRANLHPLAQSINLSLKTGSLHPAGRHVWKVGWTFIRRSVHTLFRHIWVWRNLMLVTPVQPLRFLAFQFALCNLLAINSVELIPTTCPPLKAALSLKIAGRFKPFVQVLLTNPWCTLPLYQLLAFSARRAPPPLRKPSIPLNLVASSSLATTTRVASN